MKMNARNVIQKKNFKKELAYHWILQGELNGFLAYYNGVPIGWCNADDKQHYDRLRQNKNPENWIDSNNEDKVLSIVCFIVSPIMRGKGVATALLQNICLYAERYDYQYIEAYPSEEGLSVTNYHGQFSMYEKIGFQLVGNSKIGLIARKYLK